MIVSFIQGRIRLRSEAFKRPEIIDQLTMVAKNIEGIIKLDINPRVGSALLIYDPEIISQEQMMSHYQSLAELLGDDGASKTQVQPLLSKKNKIKIVKNALITLFIATTVTSFLGLKAHIPIGAAFLLLSGVHWWQLS